ncbi:hypothetical protein T484DRAFT_2606502 [Baffinella frigidus]|nr:hypothetical protein T484DRAFT_2606502 [Cryptophyta sp. CCMP2293]
MPLEPFRAAENSNFGRCGAPLEAKRHGGWPFASRRETGIKTDHPNAPLLLAQLRGQMLRSQASGDSCIYIDDVGSDSDVEIFPPAAGSSAARPISIDLDPLDNGHADTGANGMLMEAMQRTNMLQLVLFAPQLLSTWCAKLLRDVPRNGRDALDLAGGRLAWPRRRRCAEPKDQGRWQAGRLALHRPEQGRRAFRGRSTAPRHGDPRYFRHFNVRHSGASYGIGRPPSAAPACTGEPQTLNPKLRTLNPKP